MCVCNRVCACVRVRVCLCMCVCVCDRTREDTGEISFRERLWTDARFAGNFRTLFYSNTSLIRNSPPPQDHYMTLVIVLV
jgi:hypothetical protein